MAKQDDGIFGVDWDGDGKVDAADDFLSMEILEEDDGGKGGCYVATCVYGSYDCPPVWTLRRYRDYKLAKIVWGRLFIRAYYAASPTVVRLFGKTTWFRRLWRKCLDSMVTRLQAEGYAETPYRDERW